MKAEGVGGCLRNLGGVVDGWNVCSSCMYSCSYSRDCERVKVGVDLEKKAGASILAVTLTPNYIGISKLRYSDTSIHIN